MAGNDRNYVSIWFWILAMVVMAIPCVNVVMVIVWAFYGDNESRKNYFRALIIIFLFWFFIWMILVALGIAPAILKQIQESSSSIKV